MYKSNRDEDLWLRIVIKMPYKQTIMQVLLVLQWNLHNTVYLHISFCELWIISLHLYHGNLHVKDGNFFWWHIWKWCKTHIEIKWRHFKITTGSAGDLILHVVINLVAWPTTCMFTVENTVQRLHVVKLRNVLTTVHQPILDFVQN